jgi:hypothetical protein
MDTVLLKEITVPLRDSSRLEYLLISHGFRDFSLIYNSGTKATVTFSDEGDAVIFMLKGILEKLKDNSVYYSPEPEFDFMIRLEKKLKSYSICDEYIIRKKLRDT